MGEITDAVGIQFRLLNTSRGPAVWSPRAQCDKQAYRLKMREVLESQPNLKIKQAEVADLIIEESLCFGRSSLANDPTFTRTTNDNDKRPDYPRHSPSRRPNRGRRGRYHHDRHIPQRADPLRRTAISRRTLGRARSRAARRIFEKTRPPGMPAQDRHASATRWAHH